MSGFGQQQQQQWGQAPPPWQQGQFQQQQQQQQQQPQQGQFQAPQFQQPQFQQPQYQAPTQYPAYGQQQPHQQQPAAAGYAPAGYPPAGYPPAPQPGPAPAGMGGMGPPPVSGAASQYAAYPEYNPQSHVVGGRSYQGPVTGMSGWNDPPKAMGADAAEAEKALAAVQAPEGVIVAAFTTAVDQAKALVERMPAQRAKIEDTDRRIEGLFDRLANHKLERVVLGQTLLVAQALDAKQYAQAQAIVMKMMKANYANETAWILGAKRLTELLLL
ncbi:hypothetical protein HK105_209323 [Polyrhizophydium stewartii]|uniref:Uncharacterized protein n=1 Tax=Polyrhizophydium stewartii TaxID=2732419 RepID=A0ABR4MVB3_9FUNG